MQSIGILAFEQFAEICGNTKPSFSLDQYQDWSPSVNKHLDDYVRQSSKMKIAKLGHQTVGEPDSPPRGGPRRPRSPDRGVVAGEPHADPLQSPMALPSSAATMIAHVSIGTN